MAPCLRCGDVFPTHPHERYPNHPYVDAGDQGFKLAYKARATAVLEWLKAVADKTAGREAEHAAYPFCMVSDAKHNWRSCLKRMKCRKKNNEHLETVPPGDSQELREGYQSSPCENCCTVVPDHFSNNCPHPELPNFGVRFTIIIGEGLITWMVLKTGKNTKIATYKSRKSLVFVTSFMR